MKMKETLTDLKNGAHELNILICSDYFSDEEKIYLMRKKVMYLKLYVEDLLKLIEKEEKTKAAIDIEGSFIDGAADE